MNLIDGKALAERINEQTRVKINRLKERGITPGLAVVLVGDDPASIAYTRTKDRISKNLGFFSRKIDLGKETSQSELLKIVGELNADPAIHGILVQSPPPPHIDEERIVVAIDPAKDVDGFHPMNVGKLAIGDPTALVPCTPLGCQRLLLDSGIETSGAQVVIIGRSMLVGKPLALLLMRKGKGGDATVTVAHSRSRDLANVCRTADILVAAIGKPEFVRGEFVKEGAVVIDVGVNRVEGESSEKGYRITGDVAFEETASKARAITPVPGGVGPMTVAMLMVNTVTACEHQTGVTG
ncbi:MAG: bifunctional 5,10-methylene-tetrahydrofolate dehydrogenase/5,10-methylene-tetrahydrofolate cyclohydrolase [Verrucomicrobia bacterium]|nr:bifunctional 5,10-methylene-tetrahydrofolate dehydrogenase/5,10-methylene-tetrahydrofolate cyclohydrolase [Verrucomicrobiota bacterium]MBV9129200.1 bifunctional 5,10-methylene-tetrahydrofolate dehydrogenase/5,10-methylene-tetrahydrofolate cyclohydrolase [Verrucomicrobiota bacterium]MBV9643916.1 bifunctional 5,10-methylene-tetrahydrofolate dehydrogenase/5,10-methylene-tetrahydrofolate cyclohydrolase [Verrucomicrobiota bacterium]